MVSAVSLIGLLGSPMAACFVAPGFRLPRISGGQELAEAVAAGCLRIGNEIACTTSSLPSMCLCPDMAEVPRKLRTLRGSPDLQFEVLALQDEKLAQHLRDEPLRWI